MVSIELTGLACTLLAGSSVYPYYLEFDGISKGNPGHAGIGAVLTTPNQEHEFGQVSLYIGSKSTKHLAQYEALIAGLEIALTCGVKCLHACSDNMLIVNQVMATGVLILLLKQGNGLLMVILSELENWRTKYSRVGPTEPLRRQQKNDICAGKE